MITRTAPLAIDSDDPFKNDPLQRSTIADNLTSILTNCDTPFVMTIGAPWGHGKTTFIKMWQRKLQSLGFGTAHFDAWENDHANDPFVSFVSSLEESIQDDRDADKQRAFVAVKACVKKVVAASPKIALNWALRGGLQYVTDGNPDAQDEIDAITKVAATLLDEEIEKQSAIKTAISELKNKLTAFADEVSESGKPLIVFVDELDRCRPDFTVELLERIKHVFSAKRVIFILAVDQERLGYAASKQIGFLPSDANGYLRRFIDLQFRLPAPNTSQFLHYLSRHNPIEIEGKRKLIFDVESMAVFIECLGLTLREIEQCWSRIQVITLSFPNIYEYLLHGASWLTFYLAKHDATKREEWLNGSVVDEVVRQLSEHENRYSQGSTEQYYLSRSAEYLQSWFVDLASDDSDVSPSRRRFHEMDPLQARQFMWDIMQFAESFRG